MKISKYFINFLLFITNAAMNLCQRNPALCSPSCHNKPFNDHLQVSFSIDITLSARPDIRVAKHFFKEIDEVAEDIREIDPDAEFALTYQANWPLTAYARKGNGHSIEEGCYIRKTRFDKDVSIMKSIARTTTDSIHGPADARHDAALPAVAFAAADQVVGWNTNKKDEKGRTVRRFVVMLTDDDSVFQLKKPGNRTQFRLDGTDSCATTLPPSYEIYRKVFTQKDINVIGLYTTEATESKYVDHFKEIEIPLCSILYRGSGTYRKISTCIEKLIRCT